MDNLDTISNPTLKSLVLKRPIWPARFSTLGSTRSRKQADGVTVLFVAVNSKVVYTGVPSILDGYSSDWYTVERRWVPFDSLEPGQLEITKVV